MGLTALLRSQPARRHFIFVPYRHYASKEFDASRKESLLKHLRERYVKARVYTKCATACRGCVNINIERRSSMSRLRKDDELNGYTKETVKGILDGKVRILTGPECELRFKCILQLLLLQLIMAPTVCAALRHHHSAVTIFF
jgi:hypothetical protein